MVCGTTQNTEVFCDSNKLGFGLWATTKENSLIASTPAGLFAKSIHWIDSTRSIRVLGCGE